ncbi:hypothetical protein Q8F55_001522 [Vanrija albida]|uniref:Tubby C-terminal domain-containing protein n=1 Tax=Vanrija albida TaxID=181172 RepID=A0ABR3QG82_9TREE
MADYKPAGARELLPIDPSVGVLPGYIAREPTVIYLRDKLLTVSDTDSPIRKGNGDVVLRFTDKAWSVKRRTEINDAEGNPLLKLRCNLATIQGHVVADDAGGTELFNVQGKFKLLSRHYEVSFKDVQSKAGATVHVRGDKFGSKADVVLPDGRVLAQIDRQLFTKNDIVKNNESYYIWIAQGVDVALITGICVAVDMIKEQRSARRKH